MLSRNQIFIFKFILLISYCSTIYSCSFKSEQGQPYTSRIHENNQSYLSMNTLEEAQAVTKNETNQISELDHYQKQYIWLKNVSVVSVEKFTSKKGSKILKIKLLDNNNKKIEGIFYESDWSEQTLVLIESNKQFDVLVKVGSFRGETSFNAKYIHSPTRNIASEPATSTTKPDIGASGSAISEPKPEVGTAEPAVSGPQPVPDTSEVN